MPTTQHLADIIRGAVAEGKDVDPVALAREAREGVDNIEGARAVQVAQQDARRLFELALTNSWRELLPVVRAGVEEIYAQVRALPDNTPTTSDEAVHADEKGRKAFMALEELSARHSRLRRLHRQIIIDDSPSMCGALG